MPKKKKQVIGILFIELILAALFVFQFFQIVKMNFITHTFTLSQNFFDLIILAFLALVLLAVFGIQRKKVHEAYLIQLGANTLITETAKQKLKQAKEDPRLPALLLLEFTFVVMVVIAIAAALDPQWTILNWEKQGIEPPLSTILSAIVSIAVIILFILMYNFTKNYRFTERTPSRTQKAEEKITKKIKKKIKREKEEEFESE